MLRFLLVLLKLAAALLLSASMGFLASRAVLQQYEWGYELVQLVFGTTGSMWELALSALYLQAVEIPLVTSALFFGYSRCYFNGPKWWRIVSPISFFLPFLIAAVSVYFEAGISTSSSFGAMLADFSTVFLDQFKTPGEVANLLFGLLVNGAVFFAALSFGEFLFISLAARNKPMKLILPGMLALAGPFLASSVFDLSMSWESELAFDFSLIAAASALAVLNCRFTQLSNALCVVAFTTMPFVLFNLSNLLFVTDFPRQNLEPALLSAISISIVTFLAAVCGAQVGLTLVRNFARPAVDLCLSEK